MRAKVDSIRAQLPTGSTPPIVNSDFGDLAITIERRYAEPPRSLTRVTTPDVLHQPSIVIGISMKSGRNIVKMSAVVERVLKRLRTTLLPPDIALTRINDLPRQIN